MYNFSMTLENSSTSDTIDMKKQSNADKMNYENSTTNVLGEKSSTGGNKDIALENQKMKDSFSKQSLIQSFSTLNAAKQVKSELKIYKKEISNLKEILTEYERQNKDVQSHNDKLEILLKNNKRDLSDKMKEIDMFKNYNEMKEAEILEIKNIYQAQNEEIQKVKELLVKQNKKDSQNFDLKSVICDLKRKMEESERLASTLKKKNKNAEKVYKNEICTYKNNISVLSEKNDELKKNIEDLKNDRSYKTEFEKASLKIVSLKEELEVCNQELNEANDINKTLRDDNVNKNLELEQEREQISSLKQQLSTLEEGRYTEKERILNLEAKISKLEDESKNFTNSKNENLELKQRLSDAQQDLELTIKNDKKKVHELSEENRALEVKASKIRDVKMLQTDISNLRHKNSLLKVENTSLIEEIEKLLKQNKTIYTKSSKANNEDINDYKNRLEAVESDFNAQEEDLRSEISILNNSLKTKESIIAQMFNQVNSLKSENSEISTKMQGLYDEIDMKSSELNELRSKLRKLDISSSENNKNSKENKHLLEKIENLEKTIQNLNEQIEEHKRLHEFKLGVENELKNQNKNICKQNIDLLNDRNYWLEIFQQYFGLFGKEESNLKEFYQNVLKFYKSHPDTDFSQINSRSMNCDPKTSTVQVVTEECVICEKYKSKSKKYKKECRKYKKICKKIKSSTSPYGNSRTHIHLNESTDNKADNALETMNIERSSSNVSIPWSDKSLKDVMKQYKSEDKLRQYQDLNKQLRNKLDGSKNASATLLPYNSISEESDIDPAKSVNSKLEKLYVNDEFGAPEQETRSISTLQNITSGSELLKQNKNWNNMEKLIKQQHGEAIKILKNILREVERNHRSDKKLINTKEESHNQVNQAVKDFNNNLMEKFQGVIRELSSRIDNIQSMTEISNKNRDSVSNIQASIYKRRYTELEVSFRNLKQILVGKSKKDRKLFGKEISAHINKLKKLSNKNVKKLVGDLKEVLILVDEGDKIRNAVESVEVDQDSVSSVQ